MWLVLLTHLFKYIISSKLLLYTNNPEFYPILLDPHLSPIVPLYPSTTTLAASFTNESIEAHHCCNYLFFNNPNFFL